MKYAIIALYAVAIVTSASAFVAEDCHHLNTARCIDELIIGAGFSSDRFVVNVDNMSSGMSYIIVWKDTDWSSSSPNHDCLAASIFAVAEASEQADWSSTNLYIGFDNAALVLSTNDARWLGNNVSDMTNRMLVHWIDQNVTIRYY